MAPDYRVVEVLPATRRNPDTGRLEGGVEITFADVTQPLSGRVFLANDVKTVDGGRALIEHELAVLRGLKALGS